MRRLAAKGADEASMIEVHTRFHLALYRPQGNALLLSLIKFFATIQRSMTVVNSYRTQDTAQFVDMHAALVDAIESGDVREARRRLLAHFEEALQWSRQAVESAGVRPTRPRQSGTTKGATP
jgi:DNA-binding GntR family transcriptional regulator